MAGIIRADVREIALGAIAGWADGWTGDDGVNPQRRVRVAAAGDRYVDLRVEGAPGTDEPDKLFRVTAVVTETLRCDPAMPSAQSPVPHQYDVTGTEDGSLADGGSYEVLKCRNCSRTAYRQLPD